MSLEPAHARPNDPSDFVCSSFTPASPRCCPASGCLPCLSFPSSSSVVFWLLIWPETGSQRDITLHQYHAVSLTHLSKNASYSSFLMPPINLQMSSSDRTEGDTGGQRGKRGGGQRGHYRGLFILQGWQKTLKCWGWIMLSNTDCDFFRGKTTVFGKLGVTLTLESSGLLSYCGLTEDKMHFSSSWLPYGAMQHPSEMTGQSENVCSSKCHLLSLFSSGKLCFMYVCILLQKGHTTRFCLHDVQLLNL